jgi:hypothetical protein
MDQWSEEIEAIAAAVAGSKTEREHSPSKVKVHMNLCGKTSIVEVTQTTEGTYKVQVTTACDNVKEFVSGLEELTITDLIDKRNSKVFDRMRVTKMSANCLVPAGILSAAWLEAGMIAQSNAKKNKENSVEFVFD